jgi:hypothetical protein
MISAPLSQDAQVQTLLGAEKFILIFIIMKSIKIKKYKCNANALLMSFSGFDALSFYHACYVFAY